MQTIKLTKDIEHEGLAAGDVLSVDENSAAALVRRGDAEVYDPAAPDPGYDGTNVVEAEPTTYGDQEGVRTIDDIRDPQAARNRRVMSFATVAAPDPGPVSATAAEAEQVAEPEPAPAEPAPSKRSARNAPTVTTSEQAAPDAQSAGGDAGGGSR